NCFTNSESSMRDISLKDSMSSSLLSFAMVAFLPVGGTRSLLCAARSRLVVRSGAPGRGGRRTARWLWACCRRPEGEAHRLGACRLGQRRREHGGGLGHRRRHSAGGPGQQNLAGFEVRELLDVLLRERVALEVAGLDHELVMLLGEVTQSLRGLHRLTLDEGD